MSAIDPADVMAAHFYSPDDDACDRCPGFEKWPCHSYRLAEALAAEQARKPVRVSIEDTGPVLEAIAAASLGGWELLKPNEQAQYKQVVLDYIWPGLTVLVDMVNAALAEQPEQAT